MNFDGASSSDSDGETLTYAWDLDGDGSYDDSTSSQPTYTYSTAGTYAVRLQVTDARGASDTLDEPLTITAGNSPPTATIDTPLPTVTWKVGEEISFSGKASDGEDGALPASALSWEWIVHHCPTADTCHEHVWESFSGVASGTFTAPDHEYPSYLELRLTATDSGGLTHTQSVRLDPQAVELSFHSEPAGLKLMVGGTESTTPFSRTAIVGSKNSVSAPSPQVLAGTTYNFASWSDGKAQSHDIVAPSAATTYTATYAAAPPQDTTPPKVMSTIPGSGATGIAPGVNVTATFTEAMDAKTTDGDPSTINSTTFKLFKLNADGTTTRITAAVSYDAATKKAILNPSSNLRSGRTYKATVTSGAQDLAGNALDQNSTLAGNQPKSWKFKIQ